MLANVACFIYEILQQNVKIIFLKRKPFGGCFKHPNGFVIPKQANKVCNLIRSKYGLKQPLCFWNYIVIDVIIMVHDLIQNKNDSCVYKEVSGSTLTVNVLSNDDISFLGNDIPIIRSEKAWLS